MKLSEIVVREAIIPELTNTVRDGVIEELVEALASAGEINKADVPDIVKAVVERERAGSTGIGKGVAIPHVKHPKIQRVMAAIGRSSRGVDFDALDKAPVYSVVLLLSPPDNPDVHLQAMETIFRHLQRNMFRSFLRQSQTAEDIFELLQEADQMSSQ